MITNDQMKQYIRESNLIEGYDDPEFDAQGALAWKRLLPLEKLTHYDILKTQKILTLKQTDLQPDWRGYYRKISVYIGGHEAMKPGFIEYAMAQWLEEFMEQTPKNAHIRFEEIHPFVDGNGRTGRMLMWWQQIRRGEKPTLILNAKKQEYYRWFDA